VSSYDIAIIVRDTEVGNLTYGVKDLNLTLRGDGDIILATDDGVLTVRAPGALKAIIEAVAEAAQDSKATSTSINTKMQGIQEKIQQLRDRR
jgi:hypothetical protein